MQANTAFALFVSSFNPSSEPDDIDRRFIRQCHVHSTGACNISSRPDKLDAPLGRQTWHEWSICVRPFFSFFWCCFSILFLPSHARREVHSIQMRGVGSTTASFSPRAYDATRSRFPTALLAPDASQVQQFVNWGSKSHIREANPSKAPLLGFGWQFFVGNPLIAGHTAGAVSMAELLKKEVL